MNKSILINDSSGPQTYILTYWDDIPVEDVSRLVLEFKFDIWNISSLREVLVKALGDFEIEEIKVDSKVDIS